MSETTAPRFIDWGIKVGKDSTKLLFTAISLAEKGKKHLMAYIDKDAAASLILELNEELIYRILDKLEKETDITNVEIETIKAFLKSEKTLRLEAKPWEPE